MHNCGHCHSPDQKCYPLTKQVNPKFQNMGITMSLNYQWHLPFCLHEQHAVSPSNSSPLKENAPCFCFLDLHFLQFGSSALPCQQTRNKLLGRTHSLYHIVLCFPFSIIRLYIPLIRSFAALFIHNNVQHVIRVKKYLVNYFFAQVMSSTGQLWFCLMSSLFWVPG